MSRRSDIEKSTIGCSSTLIQNCLHYLSQEQINFLNRGPTYVPPCQIHLLPIVSPATTSIDEIIRQQMIPLRRQLAKIYNKYRVDLSRRMKFDEEVQKLFKSHFSIPIPSTLEQRALYERQIIQSIQKQIKDNALILRRTADDQNIYYLGYQSEFNFKSNEYLQNSESFELIGIIDVQNERAKQQQFDEIIRSIDFSLDILEEKKLISSYHTAKLHISHKKATIKLPYLYFLPQTKQDGTLEELQPRLASCQNSPIQILATYLEQLLRPLFEKLSQSIVFLNGNDFMKKLHYYCFQQDDLFQTNTTFITFEIQNLSTNLLHIDILDSVNHLLSHPLIYGRHDRLSSQAIEELINIYLRNQVFTYNQKIYRHIKGIPLNFPLSYLLLNIYLYNWQLNSLQCTHYMDELFGLYYNTGFFTWNRSIDEIKCGFDNIRQKFQLNNIQFISSMGKTVHFLNVYIVNNNGQLYTRVYHNPNQQQFLLPFVTDHPRLIHRQWFRYALIRAGQYCSSFEDFYDEQRYIELTFLANGYSLDFVEYQLRQFYRLISPQEPNIIIDQYKYSDIRSYLLSFIHYYKRTLEQQRQLQLNEQYIELPYRYDWGCRWKFNRDFYKYWITILEQDPTFRIYGLKIKLISKHCYLSNTLLAQ